jgi:glycerophosphoryl diester phosphodiesterase
MRNSLVRAFTLAAALSTGFSGLATAVEIQGHRGARGLVPENTLPAFEKALELGVDVLELDTVVTADGVAVIHHDRALSKDHTRRDGAWIDREILLNQLTAAELETYDVGRIRPGSRYAKRFPDQAPVDGTMVPKLSDLFAMVAARGNETIRFNIETKRSPLQPGDTPEPEAFSRLLIETARSAGVLDRITLQSFDWSTLIAAKRIDPAIPTVCLSAEARWLDSAEAGKDGASPWLGGHDVDDFGGSIQKAARAAGCAVWSPYYRNVTQEAVEAAHAEGLRVIVWTVNKVEDMKRLIALGVDGIITDYPDRAKDL